MIENQLDYEWKSTCFFYRRARAQVIIYFFNLIKPPYIEPTEKVTLFEAGLHILTSR